MNRYFDRTRFARLWIAHWTESWRGYCWFVGIAVIVNVIFLALFFTMDQQRHVFYQFRFEAQMGLYTTGLFWTTLIFSGRHFKNLVGPGPALIALMRPASIFEKWLLTFLFVGILFPLVYTLLYSILNFPAVYVAKLLYVAQPCNHCEQPTPDFTFFIPFLTKGIRISDAAEVHTFFRLQVFILLILWSIQALVVGGTVFFKRAPILLTGLTLFLLTIVLLLFGSFPQLGVFWSPINDAVPHSTIEYVLSLTLWIVLPCLSWIAVFFHLKEREVS